MPVFILATIKSKPKIKDINITMIIANAYCAVCYLKRAQVFTVSKRDI